MKLENLGEDAQKETIELKAKGLTNKAIADRINADFNAELTFDDIRHYVNKRRRAVVEVAQKKGDFNERLAMQYFDSIDQIKELNSEMWDFFYRIKKEADEKNWKDVIKAAEHLLKQIEHTDKILGRLQTAPLNITYNYVDLSKKITQIIPTLFEKAEKKGAIKIKSRRLISEMFNVQRDR